ncbi:MAG: class II aldolase/adducin family protein, partial [Pseudomonadales bacterium]
GLVFGNVSRRTQTGFLISGSQTGHLVDVSAEDFAEVTAWDIERNTLSATGMIEPSSESLTHAAVYDLGPAFSHVFHVHSPSIWQHADALDLTRTKASVAYGTPAMAREVARVAQGQSLPLVLVMAGHQDGVVAAGRQAGSTGRALLRLLSRASALSKS